MHIPALPGIFRHIQSYCEPCVTLTYSELQYTQNPGILKIRDIFRTLVYAKLWHIPNHRHIQNPGLFRTGGILKTLLNIMMEHFEKQLTAVIIFASYNYFQNINFSCRLVHEINIIFNAGLIFIPEVFFSVKSIEAGVESQGTVIYLLEVLQ